MPSAQGILDGLTAIANDWKILAIAWHVVLAVGLAAFVLGQRPAKAAAGIALVLPLVSVSALAWSAGNPFNGAVFALLAGALAALAARMRGAIRVGPPWLVAAGFTLLAFGWVYPHFLQAGSWAAYLVAAPLGLVPCPTLSALIGGSLIVDGLESRGWSLTLAAAGVVYGLIGWLRLGVTIDVALLAGAVALGAATMLRGRQAPALAAKAI